MAYQKGCFGGSPAPVKRVVTNPFSRNLLRNISERYSNLDSSLFHSYLRMPPLYLRGLFQVYPDSLEKVPLELPAFLERCEAAHWRKVKMEMSKEQQTLFIKYKMARVPPLYMNKDSDPSGSADAKSLFTEIRLAPREFAGMSQVLYFHSTFEDNALLAASNIVKAGIKAGVKCLMIPFTKYLDEVKTFEESELIKAVKTVDILVLSMIGCEYINKESGFTEAQLESLVKQRRIEGKSTILSSHLNAADFAERYKMGLGRLGAMEVPFLDTRMDQTLGTLAKELAAIRAAKEAK